MTVYRITHEKWSKKITASGNPARWNSKGKYIIYTSSTRALAVVENLVHRNGEGLNEIYKILEIEIPGNIKISELTASELKNDWSNYKNYSLCRKIGDKWINECKSCVLKVPSALIKEEHNFLININHPDFTKIKIKKISNFIFDERLK